MKNTTRKMTIHNDKNTLIIRKFSSVIEVETLERIFPIIFFVKRDRGSFLITRAVSGRTICEMIYIAQERNTPNAPNVTND